MKRAAGRCWRLAVASLVASPGRRRPERSELIADGGFEASTRAVRAAEPILGVRPTSGSAARSAASRSAATQGAGPHFGSYWSWMGSTDDGRRDTDGAVGRLPRRWNGDAELLSVALPVRRPVGGRSDDRLDRRRRAAELRTRHGRLRAIRQGDARTSARTPTAERTSSASSTRPRRIRKVCSASASTMSRSTTSLRSLSVEPPGQAAVKRACGLVRGRARHPDRLFRTGPDRRHRGPGRDRRAGRRRPDLRRRRRRPDLRRRRRGSRQRRRRRRCCARSVGRRQGPRRRRGRSRRRRPRRAMRSTAVREPTTASAGPEATASNDARAGGTDESGYAGPRSRRASPPSSSHPRPRTGPRRARVPTSSAASRRRSRNGRGRSLSSGARTSSPGRASSAGTGAGAA